MTLKRVAIYGGTFDPVHNGHLEVARSVLQLFKLDELWFVPAWAPPHKRSANITSAFHRFAMLALATEADQGLLVSTVELDAPDRPYAVDTIARMQALFGKDCRLFFVMGADSWLEITTWRDWQRLLTMCDHIVVTRPAFDLGANSDSAVHVTDVRGQSDEAIRKMADESETMRVFWTDAVFEYVSATAIRALARAGEFEKLKSMVPLQVAAYIEKHGLYRN